MPRIKRWFPVNHNINRDPEVWAMRREIGEKSLSIWLEFLSIADQNEGEIPGQYESLIRSVSGTCQAAVRTVTAVYEYALIKVWLKSEPTLHVVKYWNYHKQREPINPLLGSLPSEPSEPSYPSRHKNKKESLTLPNWLPPDSWQNFKEHRVRLHKPLTRHAETLAIARLEKFRAEGHDPAEIIDNAILNGWQGLFPPRSNVLNFGGDRNAEPKGYRAIRKILAKNQH